MAQPLLTIDPEFSALCPQQSPEEMNLLEASLEADGCRDPLVVWKGHGILLDGHTRYSICKRKKIAFRIAEIDLQDRDAAIEWIVSNRLQRRNLTEEEKAYLRGKRYRVAEQKAKKPPVVLSPLDKETLAVMKDGGKQLCEDAIGKWCSGKYGTDAAQRREMISRWERIQANIGPLAKRLEKTR